MDTNKISEQVKKNMNSLQEVIHNNEVLKEKVTNLEKKIILKIIFLIVYNYLVLVVFFLLDFLFFFGFSFFGDFLFLF